MARDENAVSEVALKRGGQLRKPGREKGSRKVGLESRRNTWSLMVRGEGSPRVSRGAVRWPAAAWYPSSLSNPFLPSGLALKFPPFPHPCPVRDSASPVMA